MNPRGGEVERGVAVDDFVERLAGRRRPLAAAVVTLDRLWAGWRTRVRRVRGRHSPDGRVRSPFTAILASGLPDTETHIVWRGGHCFAILNAFPYTNGHLLVMPYREVGELEGSTPDEHAELWARRHRGGAGHQGGLPARRHERGHEPRAPGRRRRARPTSTSTCCPGGTATRTS